MNIHLALVDGRMRDETLTDHLTSDSLAAFVDGSLTGAERERTVRHLAGCRECRQELAELRALIDTMARPSHRRWLVVATAAAAVLAVVTVPLLMSDRVEDGANVRAEQDARLTDGAGTIAVVSPADQATISPTRIEFSWHAVGVDAAYTVTLQDSSGNEVWRRALSDTNVTVPDSVRLLPGLHFWSVDARLTDGTTARTGALSFIVR